MRKLSVLACALLLCKLSIAQKDIPSYGKIDKQELLSTTCAIDSEAEACVLIKTGEISFNLMNDVTIETKYRYRIKILKDKGIDRANVKVHFYSTNRIEEINGISGETYNLDASGNIVKTKMEKSAIFTKQVSKNYSELAFTLPAVKKGSIIEYQYVKTSKAYWDIDNWYFQTTIPTLYCQFYMAVPTPLKFTANAHRTLPMDVKNDQYADTWTRSYTMKNIPALKDEPYMSAPSDYMQHIDFQLTGIEVPGQPPHYFQSSWSSLNQQVLDDDDFGGQLHRNVPHTSDLDAKLANLKDSTERMAAVFDYVRHHMESNEDEGIWSGGIRSAWDKKTGSISDINLLLVNLLRDAHLDAHPILVSTRDNGRINTVYPNLAQFNETMAFVQIGDKRYVLNAADKYNPYRLVPYDVQYTEGFIVDKDMPGWVMLMSDQNKYRNVVVLSGDVDDKGKMTGTATVSNFDYSKNFRCKNLKDGETKFKETYFTGANKNVTIDSLRISGQDDDSGPLKQEADFSCKLNGSGNYLFITPNMFSGLETNPFVQDKRFTDVDFGYRQSYMIVGSVSIPDGYQFETLPKNIRMMMEDTSIVLERLMQADDTRINYRITLEFKRPVYFVDEYDNFREFYKKLYAALNEQIVIRKKS